MNDKFKDEVLKLIDELIKDFSGGSLMLVLPLVNSYKPKVIAWIQKNPDKLLAYLKEAKEKIETLEKLYHENKS